jgi:hypothetical protein
MLNAMVMFFDPLEAGVLVGDEDEDEDEELLQAASRPAEAIASTAIPWRAVFLADRR